MALWAPQKEQCLLSTASLSQIFKGVFLALDEKGDVCHNIGLACPKQYPIVIESHCGGDDTLSSTYA